MDPDDYFVMYDPDTGGAIAQHRDYPALQAKGPTEGEATAALRALVERTERDEVQQLRGLVAAMKQAAADDVHTPDELLAAIRHLLSR